MDEKLDGDPWRETAKSVTRRVSKKKEKRKMKQDSQEKKAAHRSRLVGKIGGKEAVLAKWVLRSLYAAPITQIIRPCKHHSIQRPHQWLVRTAVADGVKHFGHTPGFIAYKQRVSAHIFDVGFNQIVT